MELNVSFLMIEFLVVALAGVVMLLDLFWLKGKGVRLGWIAAAGMGVILVFWENGPDMIRQLFGG